MTPRLASLIGIAALATACAGPSTTGTSLPFITRTSTGPNSSAVTVRAADFRVLVAATGPTWVRLLTPTAPLGWPPPLQPGQFRTFAPTGGHLELEIGSIQVRITVTVAGRSGPAASLILSAAPSTLSFSSIQTTTADHGRATPTATALPPGVLPRQIILARFKDP